MRGSEEPQGRGRGAAVAPAAPAPRAARGRGEHPRGDHRGGDRLRAVLDAIAGAEPRAISAALAEHGPMLLAEGREDVVDDALAALPRGVADDDTDAVAVRALRHRLCGSVEEVVRGASRLAELDGAGAVSSARPSARRQADKLLLALWRARFGLGPAADAVASATALLTAVGDGDELCAARRCWLSFELGAVHLWLGDVAQAALWTERGTTVAELSGAPRLRAAAYAHRSVVEVVDGAYAAAGASARQCLREAAAAHLLGDVYVVRAHTAAAWVGYERLEPEAAWTHLASVDQVSSHELDPLLRALSRTARGRLLTLNGEHEAAWTVLSGGSARRGDLPAVLGRLVAVARAEVAVARRDATAVEREADTLALLGHADDAALFHGVAALVTGRVMAARESLRRVLDHPTAHPTTGAAAAACLTVLTLLTEGVDSARPLVPDLLSRVATSASDAVLLIGSAAGDVFDALLAEEAQGHPYGAEALGRLQRFRASAGAPAARASAASPWTPPVDGDAVGLLTDRETAVLACLRDGMSYEEIGSTLFITANTVKTHVRAVYRKLAVTRSNQAVRRAREMGLLPLG